MFPDELAVADPSGQILASAAGRCRGRLLESARGDGGFGYDRLFLISEYGRTFGKLSTVVKRAIGHRSRAMERLLPHLIRLCEEFHP